MGLTIHYTLKAPVAWSKIGILEKVKALRDYAKLLEPAEIGDVVSLRGNAASFEQNEIEGRNWMLCQGCSHVKSNNSNWGTRVEPTDIIGFDTWPGEGCESAFFMVCKYPETIEHDGKITKTGLKGWQSSDFCKTQYAFNSGSAHFLYCHIFVIQMLRQAKKLGFKVTVSDEGGYWKTKNANKLLEEVGQSAQMIASFGNALRGYLGDAVKAPIFEHPDFKVLAGKGDTDNPVFKEIIKVIKKMSEDKKEVQ